MMRILALLLLCCLLSLTGRAQLVPMPFGVKYLPLTAEGKKVRMAYMDISPRNPNGQTALLLHGKNFNGFYWRGVVEWLTAEGYRVVVPDQLGFGNSDYPDIHYSFHGLAANTAALLDTLKIQNVVLIGHSMGGMLATRFALLYPARVSRLVLENPIGLEDYRTFVPYTSTDAQLAKEKKATYASYRDYQKTYYPVWKEEYDTLVRVQALALKSPEFGAMAKANALTSAMIYEQPVVYEFGRLSMPVLLLLGREDRTVVGKALLPKEDWDRYGNYPELGRQVVKGIPDGKLVLLPGVGHIPHIQSPDAFKKAVREFLPASR